MSDPDIQVVDEPTAFADKHPYLVYTGLRAGLLLVALAICFALGARGVFLFVLAFIVSGLASFVLLVPQRDRVGQRMGGYFRGLNDKIEESARSEDDIVDAHTREQHQSPEQDVPQQAQSQLGHK